MEKAVDAEKNSVLPAISAKETAALGELNASGHRQELHRHFGLVSICGLALATGNTWVTLGGSIVIISHAEQVHGQNMLTLRRSWQ